MLKQLLTTTLSLVLFALISSPMFGQRITNEKGLKMGHARVQTTMQTAQDFDELVSVPSATPQSVTLRGATEVEIGSSYNIYSILLGGQNQVAYHPDLNAVTFIHRQNNGNEGGSGIISYEVSFDGGKTWDPMDRRVTPTLDIAGDSSYLSNGNRYPSGTIYNPPGNEDPANAFFVGAGPSLHEDPVFGNGWGYEFVASSPLMYDGTGITENYYTNADTTSFHPYALTYNPDGSIWYVSTQWNTDADPQASTTDAYGKLNVCKLTFNGTGFDREIKTVLEPNWGVLGDNMWHIQGDYNLTFSPDGQTGYVVYVTTDVDNEPYGEGIGMKPVIWKSTDAGETWTKYAQVDYQSMPELIANTFYTDTNQDGFNNDTSGLILPYMTNMDITCDMNGDLHIMTQMNSRSNTTQDSIGFGWFNSDSSSTVFHFITDGVDWDAKFVYVIAGGNGAVGSVAHGERIQASRSPSGDAVFCTYLQSYAEDYSMFLDENSNPDIFAYAYHIENDYGTRKWLTDPNAPGNEELFVTRNYWFATLSPVSIANGEEHDYELPIAFAFPSGDDLSPPIYFYLYGAGFSMGELTDAEEVVQNASFVIAPNPASFATQVNFDLVEAADSKLSVFDMSGKMVMSMDMGKLQAGHHSQVINTNTLSNGMYMIKLDAGQYQVTQKLIIH